MTKSTSTAIEGEVIEPVERASEKLDAIAAAIRREFAGGIDAQFAIGHLLISARELLPSNQLFGKWFDEQGFPFQRRTAHRLREAAEREDEVREFLAVRSGQAGQDINLGYAMQLIDKPEDDRHPPERVKAVQALLGAEPESDADRAFARFTAAAEALDVSQLTEDELIELAGIIRSLADAYNAEKERR